MVKLKASSIHNSTEATTVSISVPDSLGLLSSSELDDLVVSIENAEQKLSSLRVRVAARAEALHQADRKRNKTAEDTLRGSGKTPARSAKQIAESARQATRTPELGQRIDEISQPNLNALTKVLSGLDSQQRCKVDMTRLAEKAASEPADRFARTVASHIEADLDCDIREQEKRRRSQSFVKHWFDPAKQMGHIYGELDPIRYEAVAKALDKKVSRLANKPSDKPTRKDQHLAAEALTQLVAGSHTESGRAPSADLLIIVDEDTAGNLGSRTSGSQRVCETENGTPVSDDALAEHACNATTRTVTLDPAGVPVNVGRKQRTATDAQWSAIKAIYNTCAWDECGTRIGWCQPHHIKYWRHGGKTDLENLVPLCSDHHHKVHDEHWKLRLQPDRSLEIKKPDGSNYCTTDPPSRIGSA